MFRVNGNSYSTSDFIPFLSGRTKVQLSRQVISCIKSNRKCLEESLANGDTIYGVNTGFGALSQVKISENDQKLLQLNLVRSHSAGTGTPFSPEVVRLTMVLKLLDISFGYSGVRLEVAKQLMDFLNHDILPVVPSKGSVGASGDLAQLSHIALALIGEGDVQFEGRVCPSIKAIKKAGLTPLTLHTKEGLTLVNGTQVSTALGVAASCSLNNLLKTADVVGALSVEASLASRKVFRPAIHRLKKHPGQILVSRNIWNLLAKSEIVASHRECGQVQDPYSLRCIPHVHGSSREVISPMIKIIENEINTRRKDSSLITEENFEIFKQKNSYLLKGIYVDQLKIWAGLFPKEQIFTLSTKNLNSEPITALESVFQYLNLPDYKIKNIQRQKQKKYVPMNSQTRKILIEFFKPHNERLFKFIGKKFDWDE